MKYGKLLLTVGAGLLLAGSLAACGGKTASSSETTIDKKELKPYGKYSEPVSFTIGKQTRPLDTLYKGDTLKNNPATRYLKKETNISVKTEWTTSDFNQKVALALSTGEIPDVMSVYQDQFNQLLDNDLIEDLTTVYKKGASKRVKDAISSYDQDLLGISSRDGKLMAIPQPYPYFEENITWIRKDWLDKLHLDTPETLADLENVAKQFVEKDASGTGKTLGITLRSDLNGFDGTQMDAGIFFNQFGAFPRSFVKKDGKVVYGSIEPETKDGLAMLRRWYKEGIIDKEFATRTDDEKKSDLADRMGIYVGPFWGTDMVNSYDKDKNANWIAVTGPVKEKGDKFITTRNTPVFRYIVVRKGFKHPEMVMRAINSMVDFNQGVGSAKAYRKAEAKKHNQTALPLSWALAPIDVNIERSDKTPLGLADIENALKTGDTSKLSDKNEASFAHVRDYPKTKDKSALEDYLYYHTGIQAATNTDKIKFVDKAYYGDTPSMVKMNANLIKLENETFIKIIMGQSPLSDFDKFVTQWKAQGGDTILKEVNAAVDKGEVQ
ncbi:extracellular solute-binding protein [Lacticaseibacillus daqingensis]|uniref:extracellular solute-binding protein n=1 Tax=Lacticaseibacillus daqingensis TaxID=2486014 RepID=UPI000F7756B5|nr:extracellular solute-binding protein [Lacticaseibacillus daqingensis]